MSELQTANPSPLKDFHSAWNATAAIPWWLQAIVLLGALLMATGALIALLNPAMLVSPHDEINAAVHIYAGYLFSRNAALASHLAGSLDALPVQRHSKHSDLADSFHSIARRCRGLHGGPLGHRARSCGLWSAVLVGVRTPLWSSVLAEASLEPSLEPSAITNRTARRPRTPLPTRSIRINFYFLFQVGLGR
jgi:hypothetical protein